MSATRANLIVMWNEIVMDSEVASKRTLNEIRSDSEGNHNIHSCIEVPCDVNSKLGRRDFGRDSGGVL